MCPQKRFRRIPDGLKRDPQPDTSKLQLRAFWGRAKQFCGLAQLLFDPRREHREALMQRFGEPGELEIEPGQVRLAFGDRRGQRRRRDAALDCGDEPLETLRDVGASRLGSR